MESEPSTKPSRHSHSQRHPAERTPALHRYCDLATETLLYATILLGPWMFGTTTIWAIRIMNGVGYALGILLLIKWIVRRFAGFRPERWGWEVEVNAAKPPSGNPRSNWPVLVMAILTALLLGYCLVSAVNARATYDHPTREYLYHDNYISWLPHSYDRSSTWFYFYQYAGIACVFWALRDWLLVKTRRERHANRETSRDNSHSDHGPALTGPFLPEKLHRLLWVLCINGAILGMQGILQRLDQSNEVLWLVQPRLDNHWKDQFGAYPYRGNAAQYFNLVWPVCLGFWWTLYRCYHEKGSRKLQRLGDGAHIVLLPCTAIMAACPLVAANRAGTVLAIAGAVFSAAAIFRSEHGRHRQARWGILVFLAIFLGIVLSSDIDFLRERMNHLFSDNLGGRKELYESARRMADDYGWLGSGPGTFSSLYQFYMPKLSTFWEAQAHDDWLETRVTFGRLGFGLIMTLLGAVVYQAVKALRHTQNGGMAGMILLSLAICLIHAKVDFPLQVDSILRLLVLLCGILTCLHAFRPTGNPERWGATRSHNEP